MKKLSRKQFEKAAEFINTNARPIDRYLFDYYFQNGTSESVLNALTTYQNEDGGVGRAIEPDIRSHKSSPIATSVAMQYARNVHATWKHPFINGTMNYFINTYRTDEKWHLKQAHMNDHAHADWWHFTDQDNHFEINPGAEIVGYFHAYPQSIPSDLLPDFHHQVNHHVFQYIEGRTTPIEYHEALCYLRLAEEMPDPGKTMIIEYLRATVRDIATLDSKQWGGYCAKPLWLAPSPNSFLFNVLEDVVQLNLDYEIDHQQSDGSWLPFWEWGQYRDVWEKEALNDWKGHLTVQVLKMLKGYERIEK